MGMTRMLRELRVIRRWNLSSLSVDVDESAGVPVVAASPAGIFSWFHLVPPSKCRVVGLPEINSRRLPSISFSVHYSLVVSPFNALKRDNA